MTALLPNESASADAAASQEPKWFIDEGVPGVGERPAWLGDRFKTAADLAKSYKELEQRIGVVPESYDFSKSEHLDPDYTPFQELQELAKSKRVPQDVMDKMVESVDKYLNEFTIDYSQERAKLGDNAKERLTTLDNWAKANLSENSYNALTDNLKTADAVLAIEELRNKIMSNNTVIPNGNDGSSTAGNSMEELQAELSNNLEKYKSDPKYRKEWQAKMDMVAKTSGFVDKNM
jgi:hypothetical protein